MSDQSLHQQIKEITLQVLEDEELLAETGDNTSFNYDDLESIKLLGSNAVCDSLDLVSFLVSLEEMANDTFDKSISLMDDRAMSQEKSPFRNLKALTDYIELLLKE